MTVQGRTEQSASRGPVRVLTMPTPRNVILAATQNPMLDRWARRHGLRLGATRFVAGETVEDCIAALHELDRKGLLGYAIMLGESVTDRARIPATVEAYCQLTDRLAAERLATTMSLKLTHLGMAIDERLAFDSALQIISRAAENGMFVRLDMEDSRWVDATLRTYRRLRAEGISNTGVVLQAYLHRTLSDLQGLAALDVNVRVVKGAYLEPASVAVTSKREVDRSYLRLIDAALSSAKFTAIATHDGDATDHARRRIAQGLGHPEGAYEFQMLYGVRSQLQLRLAADHHPVRVCVPYGEDWFVYFGRRLAERPANVLFVLRSLFSR